jgi:hypothetical protein
MKKIIVLIIYLCLLWTLPCFAQSSAISNGTTWLFANQNADGSWGAQVNVTLLYSTEVANSLKSAGTGSITYTSGITWLALQTANSTDELSRQIYSLYSNGTDSSGLINTLLGRRNMDGIIKLDLQVTFFQPP